MRSQTGIVTGRAAAFLGGARDQLIERLRRSERTGSLWQFMAWCFIVAETLDRNMWLGDSAHAAASEEEGGSASASADAAPAAAAAADTSSDDGNTRAADEPASAASSAHSNSSDGFIGAPIAYSVGDGLVAPIGSGSIHAQLQSFGSLNGMGGHGYPGGGGGTGGPGGGTDGTGGGTDGTGGGDPPGIQFTEFAFDPASLDFFSDLETFTQGLGFSESPAELARASPGTSGGAVGMALDFTEQSLTPVGYWTSLSPLEGGHLPTTADRFSVDWLVQLNGVKDGAEVEAQKSNGFGGHDHDIMRNFGDNQFGNEASAVDQKDWTGTLWVRGNYYEFNTIIQVNVLWDNDKIIVEDVRGPDAGSSDPFKVRSGDNTQENTASIKSNVPDHIGHSRHDDAAPSQLIMGGRADHYATAQINSIVDTDDISFNLVDLLGDTAGSIDFGSVFAAGHKQSNTSAMTTGNGGTTHGFTPEKFYELKSSGPIKFVNGDYYEFNTIVQMNVIFDRDDIDDRISASGSGGGGSGSGLIASGGVLQFNRASIINNDQHDDLFVGGQYSQYNLVMQINALDDEDRIAQIRTNTGVVRDPHVTLDGHQGDSGHDGEGGASLGLPSIHDDPMFRGADAMVS